MKNRKKKYKSVITGRILESAKKAGLALFVLFLLVNMNKIRPTNSAFTDSETSAGNTMTAGYWIPPTISIISPAGGEVWQAGSSHNITWNATSADPSATAGMDIDLDYSCDSGTSWYTIIHDATNSGTKSWNIPIDALGTCKVKVAATDSHALTNSVESNDFEIKSPIVLNEFMPDPVGDDDAVKPGGEWVELYNNSDTNINVNGWYLYDSVDTHALQITTGNSDNNNDTSDSGETIVPAHGWLVVYRDHDGDFELNNTGDTVRLYNKMISAGGSLIDSYAYTVSHVTGDSDPIVTKGAGNSLDGDVNEYAAGKSWARYPDGTGAWFDPIPTPGEENTKSLNMGKFIKYYSERCVENEKVVSVKKDPVCETKFLIELGILDKYGKIAKDEQMSEIVEPNVSQDNVQKEMAVVGTVPASSTDAPVVPDVAPVTDPKIANDNVPPSDQPASGDVNPPVEEPKIISKEFSITLAEKLDVPDGFLADTEQKMKKIELLGEEKVINALKDFEIDLAKIKIDKAGKIEILVSDLNLPKDVDLVTAKKDDTVVLITVSEKPKKEPEEDLKKDEKVSEKPDVVASSKDDEIKAEEKKDDPKDKIGGDGSGDTSAPKSVDSVTK